MQYYLDAMRNYVGFDGRATRTQYWMYILFVVIISIVAIALDYLVFRAEPGHGFLYPIIGLIHFLPSFAILFRRLHDTGRSGWWWLLGFIPIIGGLVLLFFCVQPSEPGANRFGPRPA